MLRAITKPVREAELLEAVHSVLAGAKIAIPVPPRPVTRARISGRAPRILLAEDNIINQRVALGLLKKLGLHAEVAANGALALEALEQGSWDLVLMDMQMPEVDGLQATRAIRDAGSRVRDHRVPIIAMTANAMQGDREACLAAGMNDYLSKPISLGALATALKTWLPGEPAPASSR
jgi:CheY-like chemotaxis protein